jgi:hypothetical protein
MRAYDKLQDRAKFAQAFSGQDDTIVTELVEGILVRYGIVDGVFWVGDEDANYFESEKNLLWKIAQKYGIEKILRKAFADTDVVLYGVIYGASTGKKITYGVKKAKLLVFDVFSGGRYFEAWQRQRFFQASKLISVPALYSGKYSDMVLRLVQQPSALDASVTCKGLVIRAEAAGSYPRLGRKILRYLKPPATSS